MLKFVTVIALGLAASFGAARMMRPQIDTSRVYATSADILVEERRVYGHTDRRNAFQTIQEWRAESIRNRDELARLILREVPEDVRRMCDPAVRQQAFSRTGEYISQKMTRIRYLLDVEGEASARAFEREWDTAHAAAAERRIRAAMAAGFFALSDFSRDQRRWHEARRLLAGATPALAPCPLERMARR